MAVASDPPAPKGKRYRVDRRRLTQRERIVARLPWLRRLRPWHLLSVAIMAVLAYGVYAWFGPARPPGEVLATVAGDPVTTIDVGAEGRALGIPPDQIDAATRKALLQRVIDRRLLAAAARRQGIETNADFRADRARADEMMLAGVIARRFARTDKPVSDAAARRFAAAYPAMFAARTAIAVDAITADIGEIPEAALKDLNTMADAERLLQTMHIPIVRATARLNSATLPPAVLKRLVALKPGELFILPRGRDAMIGTVVARVPNPAPAAEQLAAARAGAEQRRAGAALDAALATLRTTTRIDYPAAASR